MDATFVDPAALHQSVAVEDKGKRKTTRTILGDREHAEDAQPAVKSPEALAVIKTALRNNFLFKHLEEVGCYGRCGRYEEVGCYGRCGRYEEVSHYGRAHC